MNRVRPHHLAAATGALLLLVAPPARAEEDAEALFRQAVESFRVARFKQSLQQLERVRRLTRDAKLLGRVHLHIGINHAVFERAQPARDAFRAALTNDATLEVDPRRYKQPIVELFLSAKRTLRGVLVVAGGEAGATVTLGGVAIGVTPFRGEVAIGKHALAVRSRDGLRGLAREVLIAVGGETRVTIALSRLRGTLAVRTRPAGAEVILDGKRLGRTPLVGAGVDTGPHQLTLRLAGHEDDALDLEIGAGRRVEVERDLAPLPAGAAAVALSVAEPAPRRGNAQRVAGWALVGAGLATIGAAAALFALDGSALECPARGPGRLCPVRETTAEAASLVAAGALASGIGAILVYRWHASRARTERRASLALGGARVRLDVSF
jgi:hypothetical protein